MSQKDVITILAIIGALVVLGFVLRVTFALLGPAWSNARRTMRDCWPAP